MGATMGRRTLFRAGAVLAGSSVIGIGGDRVAAAQPKPDGPGGKTTVSVGFVIGRPTVNEDGGAVRVGLPVLSRGSDIVVHTQPVSAAVADAIAGSVREGVLVDFLTSGDEVVVAAEPTETFHIALATGPHPVFVTRKYGPELARRDGEPGAMVAAGWVYAKGRNTITVGDGRVVTGDISGRPLPQQAKRYEETYPLAEDVEVYEVNTRDWSASAPSSLTALPVTRDYAYTTRNRQAAFVVFDRDFRQADEARVRQIFYFTPQHVSDGKPVWDVPAQSTLLAGKGIDPVSGSAYVDIVATGVTAAPYTRSTEPFEIVPGTCYCVGDNEVSLYLFRCDMGNGDERLVLVDTGWPNSGYQYWKNIEAVGFDPRDIDHVLLPNGHLAGYGTTAELVTMIENAGGEVELLAPREDVLAVQTDTGELPPENLSSEQRFLRERTRFFDLDRWLDFGTVRIRPLWTSGRTAGTTSFVFELGHKGKRLTFGYLGGYGWNNENVTPANGWRRLGFAYERAWLAQTVDVDYVIGQRASESPVVEAYQTLKVHNNNPANRDRRLTMLDALGRDRWLEPEERRYRVASRSIEPVGPFEPEPETGARDVRVQLSDDGQVFQGFARGQNANTRPPLLKDGIVVAVDSFVHDPEGWYVQFELEGLDAQGGFLPEAVPVEQVEPEVTGILRTQRLNSRAEAEALARGVHAGETYRIDLTLASAIAVPIDGSPVFRPGN